MCYQQRNVAEQRTHTRSYNRHASPASVVKDRHRLNTDQRAMYKGHGEFLGHGDLLHRLRTYCIHLRRLLRAVILHSRLDSVLGEHAAVQLHWRQAEVLGDVTVGDGQHLVQRLALHPLSSDAAACNGGAAAKGFEAGLDDAPLVIYPDLKLHDVTTGWCSDEAGAHISIVLVERPNIARALVVLDNVLVVAPAEAGAAAHGCRTRFEARRASQSDGAAVAKEGQHLHRR